VQLRREQLTDACRFVSVRSPANTPP
jgi:hypothetical protein